MASTVSRSSVEPTARPTSPSALSSSSDRARLRSARLQLLEQPYVLDGDRRLDGEGRQHIYRLRGNRRAAVLVIGHENPDRPAARDHGDCHEALRAQPFDFRIRAMQAQAGGQRVRLVENQRTLSP